MASQRLVALLLLAGAGAAAAAQAPSTTAGMPADIVSRLQTAGGFTTVDLAALEHGTVIARTEPGANGSELMLLAAVKIRAPREQTVSYYRQVVTYVDGQVTLGFGRFSTPPALADVDTLLLDPDDVKALKTCKPKDCDLKLSGTAIERFRTTIDWTAPDYTSRVQAAARQTMVDYVSGYLTRGDAALATYDNESKPVSTQAQWAELIGNSPDLQRSSPELATHLQRFPASDLPGAADTIYWIKENFGLKPVISAVHAVVYQPPAHPDRTLVVQKQLYASHYYDGSLAVATMVESEEGGRPVTYVIYGNRSRGDLLRGGFGGVKRKVASDRALDAARTTLRTIQTSLEQANSAH